MRWRPLHGGVETWFSAAVLGGVAGGAEDATGRDGEGAHAGAGTTVQLPGPAAGVFAAHAGSAAVADRYGGGAAIACVAVVTVHGDEPSWTSAPTGRARGGEDGTARHGRCVAWTGVLNRARATGDGAVVHAAPPRACVLTVSQEPSASEGRFGPEQALAGSIAKVSEPASGPRVKRHRNPSGTSLVCFPERSLPMRCHGRAASTGPTSSPQCVVVSRSSTAGWGMRIAVTVGTRGPGDCRARNGW